MPVRERDATGKAVAWFVNHLWCAPGMFGKAEDAEDAGSAEKRAASEIVVLDASYE